MKKTKINIPNIINPFALLGKLGFYVSDHLTEPKTQAQAQAKVIRSLNVAGKLLLMVGLMTSWAFIIPTVFQITAPIMSFGWSLVTSLTVCAIYAALIDLPLGVTVPFMFYQIIEFFKFPSVKTLLKSLPILALVWGAVSLSMYFSWHGNTYTTSWLLQDEDPSNKASVITVLDSTKHEAEKTIRENAEDVLKEAKALDKSKFDEAKAIMKNARHEAKNKFPYFATNNWHKEKYDKIISKAKQDSSDLVFNVNNYEVALRKLEDKVHESNMHHNQSIQQEKQKNQKAVEAFQSKLFTYRILLRDLGYYATLGFVLIFGVVVLTTLNVPSSSPTKKKSKKNDDDDDFEEVEAIDESKETVEDIRRHLSQDINRLNDAIRDGKETSTYASNLVDKFGRIKTLDLAYYEKLVKEYEKFYKNKFGQDAVYDDTTAMFYV